MKLVSDFAIGITHCTIMVAIVTVFTVFADPVELIQVLEQIQGFGLLLAIFQSILVLLVVLPVAVWKLGAFGLRASLCLVVITWVSYLSILGPCVNQALERESLVGIAGSIFLGFVLSLITEPQEERGPN